jgi:hypothetical protein
MAETPPATSAHHPPPPLSLLQQPHLPTCAASCPASLAGTPHPLRPAGPPALVYDCWTLLELPDGTSRRPCICPRHRRARACYLKRLEAARPTGFYRDALRTYAGMLSRLGLAGAALTP